MGIDQQVFLLFQKGKGVEGNVYKIAHPLAFHDQVGRVPLYQSSSQMGDHRSNFGRLLAFAGPQSVSVRANLLFSRSWASITATAVVFTTSSTLAPSCRICAALGRPNMIGPMESAL